MLPLVDDVVLVVVVLLGVRLLHVHRHELGQVGIRSAQLEQARRGGKGLFNSTGRNGKIQNVSFFNLALSHVRFFPHLLHPSQVGHEGGSGARAEVEDERRGAAGPGQVQQAQHGARGRVVDLGVGRRAAGPGLDH